MKACTRPAHRGTRTLAALPATAGLWSCSHKRIHTDCSVRRAGQRRWPPRASANSYRVCSESCCRRPFPLFPPYGDGDNIAGNCKTAAKSAFLHLPPPPGELEEVQMLDAWGEDDIDVGKVAS